MENYRIAIIVDLTQKSLLLKVICKLFEIVYFCQTKKQQQEMETEKVSHLTDYKGGPYGNAWGSFCLALFSPRIMQINIARLCIPNNVFNNSEF